MRCVWFVVWRLVHVCCSRLIVACCLWFAVFLVAGCVMCVVLCAACWCCCLVVLFCVVDALGLLLIIVCKMPFAVVNNMVLIWVG